MLFANFSLQRVQRGLMTLVAGACAASLLAIGWYSLSLQKSGLLEQAANHLDLVAAKQKAAVLAAVGLWKDRVEIIAHRPDLPAALKAYQEGGRQRHLTEIEGLLADAKASIQTLHGIAVVDLTGRVVASTDDQLIGRDVSGRPEFTGGQTRTTVGDIVEGEAGEILVTVTSPLRFAGELVGVAWARLGAEGLSRITQDYTGLGETGETLVAKRSWRGDAVLVSHARFDRDLAFRNAIRPNRPERPMTHALRKNELVLIEGMVDYRGVPVVAATRYVPEVDWGIVVKIDRREVLQPAQQFRNRLLAFGAGAFTVLLISVCALSARLTAPLGQAAKQINAILTSIADGIITIDGKGRILSINPAAETMFGRSSEEIVGQNVSLLMPPPHSDAHDRHLESYRRTGIGTAIGHRREVDGRRKNGEIFPLEIAVTEVAIAGRQCFTGVVLDISARKQAEKEIERQSAELVRANDELASRNQELARLYRTAHQFIDNVSHDFRTPLTVLKEYASIIRDGSLGEINDDQAEFLDTIIHRTGDLSMMVNDVLDLSKLDAGLLGVSRRPCAVEQIVESCQPILQSQAKATQVSLEIGLEPELPEIFADPEKVGRVIVNLAVNACKFINEGGRVQLWARHDSDAAQVVVGVTDNGPGIAPDNLRAIFERFRQVGDVQKSAKGFGLGLAIVKELVELNLGDISVESREGEGSTFWFTVPTAEPLPLLKRFLARSQRLRSGSRYLTLIALDLDSQAERAAPNEFEDFMRQTLRFTDLIVRAQRHRWLIVAAIEQPEPSGIQHRITAAIGEANRYRPGDALPVPEITPLGTWSRVDGGAALAERFELECGDPHPRHVAAHRAA